MVQKTLKKCIQAGIKETLKNSIQDEFGYKVNNIKITYTENYTDIEKVELNIQKSSIAIVEPIEIGTTIEKEEDFSDVKKYIADNYGISSDNILIY